MGLKFKILYISIIVFFVICACGKKQEERVVQYSELSSEDRELIDYVNQNSNCYFKLLDEMAKTQSSEEIKKEIRRTHTEIDFETKAVKSMGAYVKSEDKLFVTYICVNNETEYNILGIHYGDTYNEAIRKIENAGFKCVLNNVYSNYALIKYNKGIVTVTLDIDKQNLHSRKCDDDDKVSEISVSIAVVDESGDQLYQFE